MGCARTRHSVNGRIWDTTVKGECDRFEIVQRWATCWARGSKGIISVTPLLKDLDWLPLIGRRRHQRLWLFCKILNSELQVPKHTVDIKHSKSRTCQSNSLTLVTDAWVGCIISALVNESGQDKHLPYWKGTILRTILEWNRLSDDMVRAADSFTNFKSRLATPP